MKFNGRTFKSPLPKAEQIRNIELAQRGDKKAKELIAEHNFGLVASIIHKYYKNCDEDFKTELFSLGCLGLWKSIERFDISSGNEFSTYAVPMIHGEMKRFIRDDSNLNIERSLKELYNQIRNLQDKYKNNHSTETLSIKEIAKILNVSEENVIDAINSHQNVRSIYEPDFITKDGDEINLIDSIPNFNATVEYNIEQREKMEDLVKAIEKLNDREQKIVKLYYGLGCKRKTQTELANMLGISQAHVNRLIKASLNKLKFILPQYIKEEYETKFRDTNESKKKKIIKKTVYSLFESYTKEEVDSVIEKLNDEEKQLVLTRYPYNEEDYNSQSLKIFANNKNINYTGLHYRVSKIIKKVNQQLINEKYGIDLNYEKPKKKTTLNKKSLYSLFPKYTEEQILESIEELSELNKRIIELRFGINDTKSITIKEIATTLNMTTSNVSQHIASAKKTIGVNLKKKGSVKMEKQTNKNKETNQINKSLFDMYPDYTEEQILNAINSLNDLNKKIIELRFGLNENNITGIDEIAKAVNLSNPNVYQHLTYSKKMILKLLENPNLKKEKTKTEKKAVEKKKKSIFELYPDYTEQQVMRVINSLNDTYIRILELKFGINNQKILSNEEIATLLNTKTSTLSVKINYIKNIIAKKLKEQEFYHNITNNTHINPVQQEESSTFSLEDKINQFKNLILSGQYNTNNLFYKGNGFIIKTVCYENACLFAYKDKKRNLLDRPHSIKKNCYVYVIRATNSNDEKISETVLVKDIKKNKFYRFVNRYTNGEYDIKNIRNDELVCFDLGKIRIDRLECKEENEIITPKVKTDHKIILTTPEENIVENNDLITKEEIHFNLGVESYKKRKLVNAEKEFLQALSSDKKYILQRTNFYLGKIYMAKKKPIIAEKYFQASFNEDNQDYYTTIEMGKISSINGDYDKATEYFNKCGEIKPKHTLHIIEQGKSYQKQEDYNAALDQFTLATNMQPGNYIAHLEKAKLLYNLNRLEESKKEIDICEVLDTTKTSHKTLLGKIKYIENNKDEAKKLFDISVKTDLNNNLMYEISDIGYFFHERGDKELAYYYYSKAPIFRKWANRTDEEVKKHIELHQNNSSSELMHSTFSFPVSFELLNDLIRDIDKTSTKPLYDIYQIHCEGAGYMLVNDDERIKEDYITILTLPFSKKIMNSYPDSQLPDTVIKKSININDLLNENHIIQDKAEIIFDDDPDKTNENNSEIDFDDSDKTAEDNTEVVFDDSDKTAEDNTEVVFDDSDKTNEDSTEVVFDDSDKTNEDSTEIVFDDDNKPITDNKVVEKVEGTIVTNEISIINEDFQEYRDKIKMLINMLDDPTQQTILLLRLGFVRNQFYSVAEISNFLNIDETQTHEIINKALNNIHTISNLIPKSIEKQLGYTK